MLRTRREWTQLEKDSTAAHNPRIMSKKSVESFVLSLCQKICLSYSTGRPPKRPCRSTPAQHPHAQDAARNHTEVAQFCWPMNSPFTAIYPTPFSPTQPVPASNPQAATTSEDISPEDISSEDICSIHPSQPSTPCCQRPTANTLLPTPNCTSSPWGTSNTQKHEGKTQKETPGV